MLTDSNYIVIQAWMRTKLGLSGPKLLCYACIWGFSQGDKGAYTGGQEYLQEWTGCDERTIRRALKDLCAAGLVTKTKQGRENIYRATPIESTLESFYIPATVAEPFQYAPDKAKPPRQGTEISAPAADNEIPDILTGIENNTGHFVQKYRTFCPKTPDILTGVNINNNNINNIGTPPRAGAREGTQRSPDIPTLEEVRTYVKERNSDIDPERFFDAYEAVGWVVHGDPVTDWRALLRKWESYPQRERFAKRGRGRPKKSRSLNYMHGKKYTEAELEKLGISLGEEFYDDDEETEAAQ
jgi:hypothetical protein